MIEVNLNDYFIKLPNNIVWTYEKGEVSLTRDMNSKTIMILANLMYRCNVIGDCYFTLEDLIVTCGYVPKTSKGKTNDQFKNVLIELQELGFIVESNIDLITIKSNTFIKCKINTQIAKDDEGNDIEFFKLNYKKYLEIISLDTKVDKSLLLNTYCYINSRLFHRGENDRSCDNYGTRTWGRAECCYFTYDEATRDLNISENTFKDHISILSDNKLIAYNNIGLVKRDDKTRMANNVYVIDHEELQMGLLDSKYYYEQNGYIILGLKSTETTKKIIGLESRINQLKETEYDTGKLEKKLDKLEITNKVINKFKEVESSREEIKRLWEKKITTYKGEYINILRDWNKKYNTTMNHCQDVVKLQELYINLREVKIKDIKLK